MMNSHESQPAGRRRIRSLWRRPRPAEPRAPSSGFAFFAALNGIK
jgi:hypothetical protein